MTHKHRLLLSAMLCVCVAGAAFAGDVAQFTNLGFSDDSRYFMFGQFGVREGSSAPYAEVYVVDVQANDFTRQGVRKVTYTSPVEPGNNGQGALYNLIGDSLGLQKQFRIDHLATGRLLYLLVDGIDASDTLEFRDFQTGRKYSVNMLQNAATKGAEVSSSFRIQLSVEEKDGKARSLEVGNPGIQRSGVKSYHIKQIVLAPDGKSHIFVIQRAEADGNASNVRYMVEAARLN
jgi:predicted secreted protein